MHSTLPTHVLALAPDSLASLGVLDTESLSELWSVFTRCKDNLQNGRRLENLSWRLWFDSGRRDPSRRRDSTTEADSTPTDGDIRQKAVEEGWSDPEWEETSDSESEGDAKEGDRASRRSPDAERSVQAEGEQKQPQRGRTVSVPAAATGATMRPSMATRNLSKEWRTASTISGDSLQRMITDASILPAITLPQRPRSVVDVPVVLSSKPALGSRGNSAPDHLNRVNALHLDSARSSKTPCSELEDLATPTLATAMMKTSPPPPVGPAPSRPGSPTLTRTRPSSTTVSTDATLDSSMPPPPLPTRTSSETAPTRRRSSVKLARAPSTRKTKSTSSAALPIPTTTTSNQLTRAPSEVHLKRNMSSAEVAASFKPRSFVQGFEVCSPPSQSAPRPQVGRIAPPPTPAGAAAVLAESPPKSRAHSTPVNNTPLNVHDKVPAPTPTASTSNTAAPPQPGPSALKMQPKPPGANKKIFFISSPNSESDDEHHSSISKESVPVGSLPKIGSPLQQSMRPKTEAKSKGKGKEVETKAEDDEDWDDEDSEDEDGSSSGWGSEYSTDSDVARNSTANGPPRPGGMGRSKSAIDPQLFAKRPPSNVHLSPSMSDMGQPGELKRRPPGLLSQLFHPDQFVDDSDDQEPTKSAAEMKRRHKSMSSLPTMAQLEKQRPTEPAKSRGLLGNRLTMTRQPTFTKKGKPEDVELESSSEEEDEEPEDVPRRVEEDETAAALARRQRLAELEQVAAMAAPPQTPRTTRRAMLATELSESLRRNLLWERQTRNRVMGGAPRPPQMPGSTLPQRPSSAQLAPPPPVVASEPPTTGQDGGLRPPNPTPSNPLPRPPSSTHVLPRRATVATDLSRVKAFPKARSPDSASDSSTSDSDDDDDEAGGRDVSGDVYTATAFGRGVW